MLLNLNASRGNILQNNFDRFRAIRRRFLFMYIMLKSEMLSFVKQLHFQLSENNLYKVHSSIPDCIRAIKCGENSQKPPGKYEHFCVSV